MLGADTEGLRRILVELIGYGLASTVALAADITVLTTLVNVAGWHYLLASIAAFAAGSLVSYAISARFVFRDHVVANKALELGYFVALGLVGLLVNSVTLFIAVGTAGMGLVTAKMIAAVCTFGANFTLRRSLLFSRAGGR